MFGYFFTLQPSSCTFACSPKGGVVVLDLPDGRAALRPVEVSAKRSRQPDRDSETSMLSDLFYPLHPSPVYMLLVSVLVLVVLVLVLVLLALVLVLVLVLVLLLLLLALLLLFSHSLGHKGGSTKLWTGRKAYLLFPIAFREEHQSDVCTLFACVAY